MQNRFIAASSHWGRRIGLLALLSLSLWMLARPAHAGTAQPARILVVGDSLSAEYGLPRGSGWVALLQKRLDAEKKAYRVVNASISGDTTSGGRARLQQLLKATPAPDRGAGTGG